ncbi:unnamed protein product [Adineta ricciae]|uniref:Uncharacterized protein n=1 Tax=Adineta ricciae TaxID=249248 RepID=A0A815KJA9_ADIRI|nr:unnamed protein product [Adineta ricciae]CAF1397020.1 unnamed protein product [Adineta ricciae]
MTERDRSEYNDLFHHCVRVLDEYDDKMSEKAFLDEYVQSHQVSNPSFISIVLTDCIRHGPLLKILLDTFYKTIDEINLRKSEQNSHKVLIYLIFFQLDSIGFPFFREIILSIRLRQTSELLQFLVNEAHLSTIKSECMNLYEEEYINTQIMRVIPRYLADLRDLAKKVKEQTSMIRPTSEPTKFQPFNLTKPKPTPKVNQCQPVPKPRTDRQKDRKTISRHQSLQSLKEKSTNDDQRNPQPNRFRASPAPMKSQTSKIPVKSNIATVLKENQFYKKQEDNVRRRLNDFEAGGKDAGEFLHWQQSKQKQDYEEELQTIERKKLEGKISYEEAILAKQRVTNENRRRADELKRQTREKIQVYVQEKLQKEQHTKQLIEEVMDGRDNVKLSQQKLRQYKTDFAKQYKEDVKQLMKQTLDEAETDMQHRIELIQQIRAIESIPIARSKPIDLTSTAGHSLHDEMSISELRQRLERLKSEREKEREARHERIIREKQIKEKSLTNTAQRIAKHRNESTAQSAIKKSRETSAPPSLDRHNCELQQHLQSRKAERLTKENL